MLVTAMAAQVVSLQFAVARSSSASLAPAIPGIVNGEKDRHSCCSQSSALRISRLSQAAGISHSIGESSSHLSRARILPRAAAGGDYGNSWNAEGSSPWNSGTTSQNDNEGTQSNWTGPAATESNSATSMVDVTDANSTRINSNQKIYRDDDGWPHPLMDPNYKVSDEPFGCGSFKGGKGVGKVWANPNYKPKPGDNYVWSTGGSSFSKYGSGKTWPNPNYKPPEDGKDNFVTFTKGSGKVWPNPNYKPQPGDKPFVTGTGKGGTGKVWPNPNYKGDDPKYVWGGGGKGSGKTWANPNYKGPPPIYETPKGKVWPNPNYKGPPVGPEFAGIGKKGGKVWPNPNYKGPPVGPEFAGGGRANRKTWPNPNVKPLQPVGPNGGGFNRQSNAGAFNQGPNAGGYSQGFNQGGPNAGGFNHGGPNAGGFNHGGPNAGGFNPEPREGGFNQGGPDPRAFNAGPNVGGFNQGGPDTRGFNQGPSAGGFNPGGNSENMQQHQQ